MTPQPEPAFRLVFRDGRKSVEFKDQVVSIGRQAQSQVCLPDTGISRRHAQIIRDREGWVLQDLGSANGTRVNGDAVKEHDLADGDIIAFDHVTARFEIMVPTKVQPRAEGRVVFEDRADPLFPTQKINLQRFTRGTVLRSPMAARGADWAVRLFSRAARHLLSEQSLDDILERVMDLVFESVPADQGVLCLYDRETGERTPKVIRTGAEEREAALSISESIVKAALDDRNAVLVSDTQVDERFAFEESIVASATRTVMCAPLYHRGDILGFVYVSSSNSRHPFDGQCLEVLTTLAVVSAVAVEQTKLRESIERQREIRARLERYSSPRIVQKIVENSSIQGAEMIAESTSATILFADICGFTSLSEKLSPAEVTQVLNSTFERLTETVFLLDGTLDKFIGDGLMAIFGAPMPQADHAWRAVRAAMSMQQQVDALNQEIAMENPLRIRVGVNSGQVVAGDIGSPTRKDYTVIGDAVNVASRLEASVARPGQVVIGPETHRLLGNLARCESLGNISVKGREEPVEAWLVLEVDAANPAFADAQETVDDLELPHESRE